MTDKPLKPLSDVQIADRLAKSANWTETSGSIQRTYLFKDFRASMIFVNKVAEYAERVQHHPDILIRWNKVTLTVNTHDAGGITEKDFALAIATDAMG